MGRCTFRKGDPKGRQVWKLWLARKGQAGSVGRQHGCSCSCCPSKVDLGPNCQVGFSSLDIEVELILGHKKSQSLCLHLLPSQRPSQLSPKRKFQPQRQRRKLSQRQSSLLATHLPPRNSKNKPLLYPRLLKKPRRPPRMRTTSFWPPNPNRSQSKRRNSRIRQLQDLEELALCPHGLSKNSSLPSRTFPNPLRPTPVLLVSDRQLLPRAQSRLCRHRHLLSPDPTRVPLSVSRTPKARESSCPRVSPRKTWTWPLARSAL
jgi:hypothetical protein